MLELQILNAGKAMPLFDLPQLLGRSRARTEVGDTIEGLIAFLDEMDGDPDLEPNGDDEGPGSFRYLSDDRPSVLAEHKDAAALLATEDDEEDDPPEDEHDREADHSDLELAGDEADSAWVEWQTRGAHKVGAFGEELLGRDRCGNMLHEDAEEDDPDTGVEDNPLGFDPEEDCCVAGDDRVMSGAAVNFGGGGDWRADLIGSEDDAEYDMRDQPAPRYRGFAQIGPLNMAGGPMPGPANDPA